MKMSKFIYNIKIMIFILLSVFVITSVGCGPIPNDPIATTPDNLMTTTQDDSMTSTPDDFMTPTPDDFMTPTPDDPNNSSDGASVTDPTATQDILARSSADVIPTTLFGMHIHNIGTYTPWPTVPFGTWRLWDASVSWPNLEPSKGQWYFDKMDSYVEIAQANNVEILLPLGLSPAWASKRPSEPSAYKPGNAAEPENIEDWKNYVRTVATRYKGLIRYYEIWNEPNEPLFFSGTVDQMITLAREAYAILKEIDPEIMVVSPSATPGGVVDLGTPWLEKYLMKGGAAYADIIGYHFYVTPNQPESMLPLINKVKTLMTAYGISSKQLWNTEAGWATPKIFSSEAEANGYVARSYILNWAAGINRFYWYAWDDRDWLTLFMTEADFNTMTTSAIAYAQVQQWLIGARMVTCGQNALGTWIANIMREDGYSGWIVWNPTQTLNLEIPPNWNVRRMKDLRDNTTDVTGVDQVAIGMAPILLEGNSTPLPPA